MNANFGSDSSNASGVGTDLDGHADKIHLSPNMVVGSCVIFLSAYQLINESYQIPLIGPLFCHDKQK